MVQFLDCKDSSESQIQSLRTSKLIPNSMNDTASEKTDLCIFAIQISRRRIPKENKGGDDMLDLDRGVNSAGGNTGWSN